jgi:hypothetical protein
MARYLVSELAPAGAQEGSAAPPAGGAGTVLPRAAHDLLVRLRALETEGPLDAQRIHERAILLEELAKSLTALDGSKDRDRKGKERVPER